MKLNGDSIQHINWILLYLLIIYHHHHHPRWMKIKVKVYPYQMLSDVDVHALVHVEVNVDVDGSSDCDNDIDSDNDSSSNTNACRCRCSGYEYSSSDVKFSSFYASIQYEFASVTGFPSLLPAYASGFWQSKLRYRSEDEIRDVVREYVDVHKLPLSVVFVDFFHWTHFGDWSFNPQCWPNVDSMCIYLSERDVTLMVSVWSYASVNTSRYLYMEQHGYFIRHIDGKPLITTQGEYISPLDPYNDAAMEYLWSHLAHGYLDYGIDLFFLDADEPQGCEPGLMYFGQNMEWRDLQVAMVCINIYCII
jgi:alpha-glucosidase (family GH31 glycosyl hydrolase)